MILKYSVGIDMASQKFDACISCIDEHQKVTIKSTKKSISNTLVGFKELETWIKLHHKEKNVQLNVCIEATGVYHENCALYLFEKNYNLSIILPNKAKKYLQAIGLKSKNDVIDAKGLAQMGAEQSLELWKPLGKFYYTLRLLTRQRQNIQEQKTVYSNQLHALNNAMYKDKFVIDQVTNTIKFLDKQLKAIDLTIDKHLSSNQEVKSKIEKICKIKGIGVMTVAVILAETNGFELFKNSKQLVSFSGYDVVENDSGKRIGKTKISKKGNSRIRRALFMPAFSVVKHQQKPFIDLYNRTYEKHGIKMKSYVAVQKKMLVMIFTLWKNNSEFDENFKKNSLTINNETIQDNEQNIHFSEPQNYKEVSNKQTENETKKTNQKVYSDSEDKQQFRQNSKLCEIQI